MDASSHRRPTRPTHTAGRRVSVWRRRAGRDGTSTAHREIDYDSLISRPGPRRGPRGEHGRPSSFCARPLGGRLSATCRWHCRSTCRRPLALHKQWLPNAILPRSLPGRSPLPSPPTLVPSLPSCSSCVLVGRHRVRALEVAHAGCLVRLLCTSGSRRTNCRRLKWRDAVVCARVRVRRVPSLLVAALLWRVRRRYEQHRAHDAAHAAKYPLPVRGRAAKGTTS